MPPRLPKRFTRLREYLTYEEVRWLRHHAREGAGSHPVAVRNDEAIRFMYRFGLTPSEMADLQWTDVQLVDRYKSTITLRRQQGHAVTTHKLTAGEFTALRKLRMLFDSEFVFCGINNKRLHQGTFNDIVEEAGRRYAKLPGTASVDWLRDSCMHRLREQHGESVMKAYMGLSTDPISNYFELGFISDR